MEVKIVSSVDEYLQNAAKYGVSNNTHDLHFCPDLLMCFINELDEISGNKSLSDILFKKATKELDSYRAYKIVPDPDLRNEFKLVFAAIYG